MEEVKTEGGVTDLPEIISSKQLAPIGWSIRPDSFKQFSINKKFRVTPESLMRQSEIEIIKKYLIGGKMVAIYGGDGYGKTTLMDELAALEKESGREVYNINVVDFRDKKSLEANIKEIEIFVKLDPEHRPIVAIDSGDYLWEKANDPSIIPLRKRLLETILKSKLPVVFTFHKNEPSGKKTDSVAKDEFIPLLRLHQTMGDLEKIELSPFYDKTKVKSFFRELGLGDKVAEIMSDNIFARNHALLKNYLVKNWEQKELPRFLNNLLNNKGIEAVKKYFNKIVRLYDHQRVFDLVKQ